MPARQVGQVGEKRQVGAGGDEDTGRAGGFAQEPPDAPGHHREKANDAACLFGIQPQKAWLAGQDDIANVGHHAVRKKLDHPLHPNNTA
jgi:hypothetical protein